MEGHSHDRTRRLARVVIAASFVAAAVPAAPATGAMAPTDLPVCTAMVPGVVDGHDVDWPWQAELDADGVVIGHRLRLVRHGEATEIRTGRRSFAERIAHDGLLIGEHLSDSTRLVLVDIDGACLRWQRVVDGLAYPLPADEDGTDLRLTLHEPGTRSWRGTVRVDGETGTTEAMIDGDCSTNCQPGDDDIPAAAFEPAGVARPVPDFPAGGWSRDKTLPFRWKADAVPPAWAKTPLKAAAEDAGRTAHARSPRYMPDSGAPNSVHYGGTRPTFCRGIACASRSLPADFWGVWVRPHGTDFGWGTLRWCQKSSGGGCFDLRRVMLHELGHVTGLDHPESGGFRLGPWETVMHAITPAKPAAGSQKHSFGPCDVATLQELYDVPTNRTPISKCNDVESRLSLTSSRSTLPEGAIVKLTATLKVAGKSDYRELAGNPLNGRDVKLKYRRAGSAAAWTTLSMTPTFSGGRYEATVTPGATWEYKAVFPVPDDEGLRYSRSDTLEVKVQG